jgi:hypothetical protein
MLMIRDGGRHDSILLNVWALRRMRASFEAIYAHHGFTELRESRDR